MNYLAVMNIPSYMIAGHVVNSPVFAKQGGGRVAERLLSGVDKPPGSLILNVML